MPSKSKAEQYIGDDAVRAKTGKSWDAWFALLDAEGAQKMEHKAIARWLRESQGLSGWWSQSVTVHYERARGGRVAGERSRGFGTSTQRTVSASAELIWAQLSTGRHWSRWCEAGSRLSFKEGGKFRAGALAHGEIRRIIPGERLRLAFVEPCGGTAEIRVEARSGGKHAIRVNHEGLADAGDRDAMKAHWKRWLDGLVAALKPAPASAGYSGTPLPKKLGIKAGHQLALLNAPEGFDETLGELPEDVTIKRALRGRGDLDVVVLFLRSQAELHKRFAAVARRLDPAGGFWVAWPKKASGVPTDMTEDRVREHALDLGLVDNKVCAVDATWSGLRCVVRKENRPAWAAGERV